MPLLTVGTAAQTRGTAIHANKHVHMKHINKLFFKEEFSNLSSELGLKLQFYLKKSLSKYWCAQNMQ